MRIVDLTRLAFKTFKGGRTALFAGGIAAAAFCLCAAGGIWTTVQEEKAQPYELVLSAQGSAGITDSMIADILNLQDVKAATPILQIPVAIQTGKYTAQLTLTGVDASYLDGAYTQGGAFPADSVMPYILLNEAACKQFAEDEKDIGNQAPDIDWLNAAFSVELGTGIRAVTSKVCGVRGDGDATDAAPAAYVSLPVAKELLRKSGQSAGATTAWVRVTNIGRAEAVSRQIAALGLAVTNSNERMQAEWDAETKEAAYLIAISAICLLCAGILLAAHRTIIKQQRRRAFEMLRWLGMKEREISALFLLHALIVFVMGTMLGVAVSMALPAFLPVN